MHLRNKLTLNTIHSLFHSCNRLSEMLFAQAPSKEVKGAYKKSMQTKPARPLY